MAIPCLLDNYLAALALACTAAALAAAAEPTSWLCGKTGNFSVNSAYDHNLQHLAGALPNLTAASSPALYATASRGSLPDAVNSAALCRGDAGVSDCRDCVATAFEDAQQICVHDKDVTIFHDLCTLRFSNENLADSRDGLGYGELSLSSSGQSASVPAQEFGAAVDMVLKAAVDNAIASSSRFGTAVQPVGSLDANIANMYALAQCEPVMTPQDCQCCLSQLLRRMPGSYRSNRDERMAQWRCVVRFDDYHQFFTGYPMPGGRRKHRKVLVGIAIAIPMTILTVSLVIGFLLIKIKRKAARKVELQLQGPLNSRNRFNTLWHTESSSGFTLFNFSELAAATGHFSDKNRLGNGGFGTVYKIKLGGGSEIAVKRLSSLSRQGLEQFKNEVQLIVKLQHTNLVRLVGYCVHEEERLLVYEYMPNGSLNCFIFDQQRGLLLDWEKRLRITQGIAQGLLYLHEHSRVRIIHHDLKTSNILLDSDMNPKISDFGLARIFPTNMTEASTNRVVGTCGYMAPEYATEGTFSVKSDVYSFGVLLLEIISGKRNSGHNQYGDFDNLLEYAWHLWREGKVSELIDPTLGECSQVMASVKRCVKVALLCVQDNARDRPTMAEVTAMLVRDKAMSLPNPKRPQQLTSCRVATGALEIRTQSHGTTSCTINDVTITTMQGR